MLDKYTLVVARCEDKEGESVRIAYAPWSFRYKMDTTCVSIEDAEGNIHAGKTVASFDIDHAYSSDQDLEKLAMAVTGDITDKVIQIVYTENVWDEEKNND